MKTTPTGRIVDERPEIQNIPIRTPEAAAIKSAIFKRAGYDFPCALHKGPKGPCNARNCKCF